MKSKRDEEKAVNLDTQELEAKLDEIERVMGAETARPFRLLLGWMLRLQELLDRKKITIARLRNMIFGSSTERTRSLESPHDGNSTGQDETNQCEASDEPETPAAEDANSAEERG